MSFSGIFWRVVSCVNEYFDISLQNFRHCVRVRYVRTLAMNIAVASHSQYLIF
jgi:hypothetical protein